MIEWINIQHRLPPDETEVLVIVKGKRKIAQLMWEYPSFEDTFAAYRFWDNDYSEIEWEDVTYWTELPEAPLC